MIRWFKSLFAWRYAFSSQGWRYEENAVSGRRRAVRSTATGSRGVDVPWLEGGKGEAICDGRRLSHWKFDRIMEIVDA